MSPVNLNAAMLKLKALTKYFGLRTICRSILIILLYLCGCKEESAIAEKISQLPLNLTVERFDREFANATPKDLGNLKSKYPYLFPEQFADSIWRAKLTDTIQVELSEEVDKAFGDFKAETDELTSLFKHIKYYFPRENTPKVVTVTSDVRYNDRVIFADSLLILGLDNYLGKDHHFYRGIQRYIAQGLDKKFLASDIASAFTKKVVRFPRNRTFLSRMVHYGKELYLKDKLLPDASDAQKMGYSQEEMDWAIANEEQIWRYFVEQELLYSTDAKLDRRFLDPAPFSKFQLELDSESPGRLGRYMGWQIVRAYGKRNEEDVQQLLALSADEIFKESNYKPRK